MNTFDVLTGGEDSEGGRRTLTDETWAQGRSTFGGLSTAFGFRHCVDVEGMPPRMVTARLWAPIPPGPLRSEVKVLHAGKSVRILRSTLSVPAKAVGEVEVVFGASRASEIVIPAPEYPGGAVEDASPLPTSGPHLPAFLQHMDVRWLEGQPPFTGGSTPVIGGFCRHRDRVSGLHGMIGLLDCWPSPALSLSTRPIAASS